MAALIRERVGSIIPFNQWRFPVGANVKIWKNAALAVDTATGHIVPQTQATGLIPLRARAHETVDNTGGAGGARTVNVQFFREHYAHLMLNDTTTPVTNTDRFQNCFMLDDQTVTADSTGTSVAGLVFNVTSEGVWVLED